MKRSHILVAVVSLLLVVPEDASAIGRRGGGGRGGGGGGGFRGGGGSSRGGGSGFHGGGGRPSMPSRPHTSTPNFGHSGPSMNRGNMGQSRSRSNFSRPSSRPSYNRPSGGLTPSSRPSTRPNVASRPNRRPGGSSSGITSNRPSTSLPNFGGSGGSRPNFGGRPEAGNRPELGNRPGGDRPGIAGRPGQGGRPSPGDVGDFLGMDRPLRPDSGFANTLLARPGGPDRPGIGGQPGRGDRPGIGDRPGRGDRPGAGGRPEIGDRPNFGDRNRWRDNNIINNRPSWANIGNDTNLNIHNRWNNAFDRPNSPGWWNRPADRMGYWRGWGDGVRGNWQFRHRHDDWFSGNWWNNHNCPIGGWHYHYGDHNYAWNYWWTAPVWGSLTNWFTWSAPADVWSQPVYYDYGTGGNVTYENDSVYVGGTEVASSDDFAASAMDLATVPPPESQEQAAEAEWMPLGTFAVSTHEKDTNPSMVVQLAVNKDGIVSGTLYNTETDQAQAIQGQVDKETQRVAFRIGESESVVAETGLYNLTEEEAPVLVHFGTDRTENYLLVRLEEPAQSDSNTSESG